VTSIDFSLNPDGDEDYETIIRLMSSFKRETDIEVNLKRMEWDNAWPQLIGISTQGQGADISHVGSTWVSSLMTMNALRPIPARLISKIGSDQAFVHSTWANVVAEEDRLAYGIPLSAYVYIVAYRKDLLENVGLNGSSAFATPGALEESVRRLESLGATESAWLMPIVPYPFHDFVSMTSFTWLLHGSGVREDISWIIAANKLSSTHQPPSWV